VRSSATAEDLPHASFAGQQDTFLHIIGTAAVLDAVRRCWASLWTDRAVVYRNTNGIDNRTVSLAVVIQRMVNAKVAGVLFTANPVTGRRRQAVIDASPGLGEAVVSGAVNPDRFVVDTATRRILERRLGDKRVHVRALPGGGTEHVEVAASADSACISDGQVRELAALGDRVEAHYGSPQDTEWAIDEEGKLWLTQARPITTLFPVPAAARPEEMRVYFCFSVAQGLNRPLTPMGMSAVRLMSTSAARIFGIRVDDPYSGAPVFADLGQRVFIDLTSTLRGRIGRQIMPRLLDVMEARSAAILRQLCADPRLSVNHRSPFLFLRRALGIAAKYAVPLQVMAALRNPASGHVRVQQIADRVARMAPPTGASSHERLAFAERILLEETIPLGPTVMPAAAAGLAMLALAGKLLGPDVQSDDLQTVLRGLPHNITTEMDLALWELAERLRQQPGAEKALHDGSPLPPASQELLDRFLAMWGHRAVAEIDLGVPRWADDPSHILGVLANYLRLEDPKLAPPALFAQGAAAAEAMIETLATRARRCGPLRAKLVRFALNRARELAGLREMPKYCIIVALGVVRRELALIGKELAKAGRIDSRDDIFFLNFGEVRAALGGLDCRPLVAERRQAYDTELRRRNVPRVILSDGTQPDAISPAGTEPAQLTGTPASAGAVTGIARVIDDPVGAHLEPGEILVAPSTDPGWTPLFLTAGGLVMEMGGANSHGAVVAREYGIPAVVGVAGATMRITTGQRITVDGAAGTVSLPDPVTA
jgi:pyruvate,water dikinase